LVYTRRLAGRLAEPGAGIVVAAPRRAAIAAVLALTCGLMALPPVVGVLVLLGVV